MPKEHLIQEPYEPTFFGKRIARVFPSKTSMTPDDGLAFVNCQPPMLTLPEIDEVHVSITFSWDKEHGEQLAEQWMAVGVPVKVGEGFTATGARNLHRDCTLSAAQRSQVGDAIIPAGSAKRGRLKVN